MGSSQGSAGSATTRIIPTIGVVVERNHDLAQEAGVLYGRAQRIADRLVGTGGRDVPPGASTSTNDERSMPLMLELDETQDQLATNLKRLSEELARLEAATNGDRAEGIRLEGNRAR